VAAAADRRWKEVLDSHDALVRRQLSRFGGREIKTLGDGFLALFDAPSQAVRCAEAIVAGVRPLGLSVRAGVHAGEVELRRGDVGGVGVHLGQRVAALAGPDEVLVSSTVKDLVVGSDIAFDDRGVHALKGIPGEWRLYAVR
jgi:class 3 adenylate cyclase